MNFNFMTLTNARHFLESYPLSEQIADHAEHRFSMIAPRRQGGEALRKLLGEEHRLTALVA